MNGRRRGNRVNGEIKAGVLLWAGGRAVYVLPLAEGFDNRQYILFKEFGLLGESLRRMEMCDFVVTPTFQKLFEEDKMIRSKDDPVKTAYNKKAKIVRILAELNGKVSMSDVQGCLVSYFMERWNQMEK